MADDEEYRMDPNRIPTWKIGENRPGVTVSHYYADCASHADLAPIVKATAFDACVVLGTAADVDLDAQSQDSRVLSILLLLRHLVAQRREEMGCDRPCHLVAENRIDQTALLALTPRESLSMRNNGAHQHLPDFINTQAIIARALAQAVAFPEMQRALSELFDDREGAACVLLADAAHRIPLGIKLPFGVINVLARGATRGHGVRDVCIGYLTADGDMALSPDMDMEYTFEQGDRLIIITHNAGRIN